MQIKPFFEALTIYEESYLISISNYYHEKNFVVKH